MPAQPNLLPNIPHRIGSSNRGPIIKEILDLHLRSLSEWEEYPLESSYLPDFLERSGKGREHLVRDVLHGERFDNKLQVKIGRSVMKSCRSEQG